MIYVTDIEKLKEAMDSDAFMSLDENSKLLFVYFYLHALPTGDLKNYKLYCRALDCTRENMELLIEYDFIHEDSDGYLYISDTWLKGVDSLE